MDRPGSLGGLVVVIPAWEPDERLLGLVEELVGCGFGGVVVVDDGSSAVGVFEELRGLAGVQVVRLERNRGKGRALKAGIETVMREMVGVRGVVTADADGQHTVADIVRVGEALGEEFVMGVRGFGGAVPLRCWVGNVVTRWFFQAGTGVRVGDTQTGWRGVPRQMFQEVLGCEGERYEWEMVVLVRMCRRMVEVPIETVYLEGNGSSHFRAVRDSGRVLGALVRCAVRG
jgi:glycosyltransferase involved in cell wall biosynthesis